jgi:hypothetical protein
LNPPFINSILVQVNEALVLHYLLVKTKDHPLAAASVSSEESAGRWNE